MRKNVKCLGEVAALAEVKALSSVRLPRMHQRRPKAPPQLARRRGEVRRGSTVG